MWALGRHQGYRIKGTERVELTSLYEGLVNLDLAVSHLLETFKESQGNL